MTTRKTFYYGIEFENETDVAAYRFESKELRDWWVSIDIENNRKASKKHISEWHFETDPSFYDGRTIVPDFRFCDASFDNMTDEAKETKIEEFNAITKG